ncbi:MAG: electron transport complex subunit RsxC [Hydrogenoanaerobacterium sp.]
MQKRHLNSIHLPHYKNTKDMETVMMPTPESVAISLLQHMGGADKPLVKVGDEVKVGQLIADSDAFLSAPIHSSVSGTVTGFEDYITPIGHRTQYIVIKTDGEQTPCEAVVPPVINSREDFLAAIKRSGLVGLGGAGFPTHIKLNPKNLDEVNTLVINAAECEPYITADNREIMECGERLIDGIELLVKYLEIKNVRIGIEDNKPQAIKYINELIAGREGWKTVVLRARYPQGAEKVIIYECTGKIVPDGKLPADVGVLVMNVSSTGFISEYVKTGMPLVTKRITVDGSAVREPKNICVPIGTRIIDAINFCGGYKAEPALLLMGGPMMGTAMYDDTYAIIKNNNAILAFAEKDVPEDPETACIHCGRCAAACPVSLMPANIEKALKQEDVEELKSLKVNLCMECGCCAYVCPAKRHLVLTNKLGKKLLRESSKK